MSKIQQLYTNESNKNKRKKILRNSTYAVIVACTIMAGATLIAVNTEGKTDNTAVIQTSTTQGSFSTPLDSPTIIKDYNANSLQYNDTLKQWEIHKGIDLTCEKSSDVLAVGSGTVTDLYTNYLEGTVIVISHSNGLTSIYKSLDPDVTVKLGKYVKQGEKIGTISSSMSRESNSGKHLHFELKLNNVYVNPNEYIDFSKK